MSPRLVIVGGGAAGMSAASAARRVDPDLEIVVLEATGHVGYGLCGLPYYVAGLVEGPEELLAYPLSFFRERRHLDVRLHARALDLDSANHVISYEQAGRVVDLAYDRVVVAAGGSPVIPPLAGVNDERVFTVRTLEDAIALRGLVDAGHVGRAVIVGAGYIGLEMAEALRARGIDVVVAEQLPRVMPNLDEPVAALVEEEVRANGVDLRLGAGVRELRRRSSALQVLVDTAWVAADIVVLAVGIRPAGGLAATAGADIGPGGALLVDARMRTSLRDVFAAGDCVAPHHRVLGRPVSVPLGPAANKTGRVAGTVAAGGEARFGGIVGTAVVKVFGLGVGRTGLTVAEAELEGLPVLCTDVVGKSRAKYFPGSEPVNVRLVYESGGRLLGAQMVGREGVAKRIDVVAAALHGAFDLDDLEALDLSYAPPYAPVYEPLLVGAQAARHRHGRATYSPDLGNEPLPALP